MLLPGGHLCRRAALEQAKRPDGDRGVEEAARLEPGDERRVFGRNDQGGDLQDVEKMAQTGRLKAHDRLAKELMPIQLLDEANNTAGARTPGINQTGDR